MQLINCSSSHLIMVPHIEKRDLADYLPFTSVANITFPYDLIFLPLLSQYYGLFLNDFFCILKCIFTSFRELEEQLSNIVASLFL